MSKRSPAVKGEQEAPLPKRGPGARRPSWLRPKVDHSATFAQVSDLLSGLTLNTVCSEARCPNIWECWGKQRTATLLIMGDICTRNCRYCSVSTGRPRPLDPEEPEKVAEAVARLQLAHAVVTSVDRDDLPDSGAGHFATTIRAIRARYPCRIEVLIPDFNGDPTALDRVLEAGPDILGHNVETVPRLFTSLRSRGDYERSLALLDRAATFVRRRAGTPITTKSGLMVGLGETRAEIRQVMKDLRRVACEVLTVGQYLNPTAKHAPIARFYQPEEFAEIAQEARAMGFCHCESGPLVRSSYRAHAYGSPQGPGAG